MQDAPPPPVITQEIRVVDQTGRPRIVMSAKAGPPSIMLLRDDAKAAATIKLDKDDRPSVTLGNPDAGAPGASLEIDGKGAHVKFDRPGGSSSYLFLNNSGGSGVVLIDPQGVRRASIIVSADGKVAVEGLDRDEGSKATHP